MRRSISILFVIFLISSPNSAQSAICAGKYHADCIYAYLINDTLDYTPKSSNERVAKLMRLGRSLLDGGYPETARLVTLRALAEMYEVTASTDIYAQQTDAFVQQLKEIEAAKKGDPLNAMGNAEKLGAQLSARIEQARAQDAGARASMAYALAEMMAATAASYAQAGNFDKAVAVANRIGDADFNTTFLLFPLAGQETRDFDSSLAYIDSLSTNTTRFGTGMNVLISYIVALTELATQRFQEEGRAPAAKYLAQVDTILARSGDSGRSGPPRMALQARQTLAYLADPKKYPEFDQIRYLLLTGAVAKSWGVYDSYGPPEKSPYKTGYQIRIDALGDFARYYAAHSDKAGSEKVAHEILKLTRETLPSCSETSAGCYPNATGGPVLMTHKYGIAALAVLHDQETIERIAKDAEGYDDQPLKFRAQLYAATALAEMGQLAKARPYADKFLTWYKTQTPVNLPIVTRRKTGLQAPVPVVEDDLADYILAAARTAATDADKAAALDMAAVLPPLYRDASYQLAIARKLALGDKDFARNIAAAIAVDHVARRDGGRTIEILNAMVDAGLYAEAEPFLHDETVLDQSPAGQHGGKPNHFGVYVDGLRTGRVYDLVGICARAHDYAAAESLARAIFDFSNITLNGGTDLAIYSVRQRALKSIGVEAGRKGNAAAVTALVKGTLQHPFLQAAAWFALAHAAVARGEKDTARRFYDAGRMAAPDLVSMLFPPLANATEDFDILAARASLERDLGLTDALLDTENMVRQLAIYASGPYAVNDPVRTKVSLLLSRVKAIKDGNAGSSNADLQNFISSLGFKADVYGREPLRKVALEYLAAGDKEKARAIALYGIGEVPQRMSVQDMTGVADVLLHFADIIAKTEEEQTPAEPGKFEKSIRTRPNIIINEYDLAFFRDKYHAAGVPPKPEPGQDYVAMGEKIFARLKGKPVGTLPPGRAGIDEAVKLGYLRRATGEDLAEWQTLARAAGSREAAILPFPRTFLEDSTYVVLREFESPSNLEGAGLVIFIVPKGGYPPSGNIGHSAVLDMNTLRCTGALCR